MNESLRYFARHNAWASKALLDVCRMLTPAQLTAPGVATYGTIIETLNHLVTSEGAYLHALGGPLTPWVSAAQRELEKHPEPWSNEEVREPIAGLDELASRIDELDGLWESFFADDFDAERFCLLDLGTYECPAGIVLAEVFHHGSVHREQICAMLTGLGVEVPDIQPWGFADATGLSRFVGGRTS